MQGLRIGSKNVWENQTYQPTTNPSEFTAKQVPCQPHSCSKQEPSVRTFWPDIEMMVSSMKLTVLSPTPKQFSPSANPNHLKKGRSENNLCSFGKCWQNSSKFSSLKKTAHVSSIVPARIVETALENPVLKLVLLGNGQVFALTAPDLHVPGIPDGVLQQVISEASTANV